MGGRVGGVAIALLLGCVAAAQDAGTLYERGLTAYRAVEVLAREKPGFPI